MRLKSTITLLLLNLATFGLIFLLQNDNRSQPGAAQGLSSQISRHVIEADQIRIEGPGLREAHPRILRREGSNWFLESSVRWPANYFAVNRILNQLQFLEEQIAFSVEEIRRTGQSLGDYGLKTPFLVLRVSGEESSIDLKIGSPTEIGGNVYILGPGGRQIHVVSYELIDSLLVPEDELRNRKVFDIPVFEIEALGVQHLHAQDNGQADLKVLLRRSTNGWRFESPLSAGADPARVTNTINRLASLKVRRFIPEQGDPLRRGLDSPSMKVTLHGNKRQQTLLIGNPSQSSGQEPAYYARIEGNPTVFTVEAKPFDELRIAQQSLRERNFMNFGDALPGAINLLGNGLEIRLRRLETGGWQVIEGDNGNDVMPRRASQAIIGKFIKDLKDLYATGFAVDSPTPSDLDRLGFSNPERTIQLSFQGDSPDLVLELAHPRDNEENLYARTNRSDYIYKIDRSASLRAFPLDGLHYRNRVLETLPEAARVSSLELVALDDGATLLKLESDPESNTWDAILAKQTGEMSAAIQTLLQWIHNVRVESLLADGFAEDYRQEGASPVPWLYRLDAQIILPGGELNTTVTRSYYFARRLSGSKQPGTSKHHKALFNCPMELIEALETLVPGQPVPPESSGQPVPDPSPLTPVPEPADAPTA